MLSSSIHPLSPKTLQLKNAGHLLKVEIMSKDRYISSWLLRADSMILDRGRYTQGYIVVAEAEYFDAVLFSDVLNELCNFIDLNGHVVVDVDDHGHCPSPFVIYFLELIQEVGRFLLVEGGVNHEQRDHRLRPKPRQHFAELFINI